MIKNIFIILILLSLSAAAFGFGSKEKSSSTGQELKYLDKYEKQWINKGIKNYTQELIYSRGNFPPEHITITVSNNTVQNWTTGSGYKFFTEDFIESLTVENMFKKARKNLNPESNSPFKFNISYNEELGYIKIFSCIADNNENKNIKPLLDKNYRFEVISLKNAKGDL